MIAIRSNFLLSAALAALAFSASPVLAQEGGKVIKGEAEETPTIDLKAEWPCVQKKVETVSASQFWDGPSIEGIKGWYQDKAISNLIDKLASRRLTEDEAVSAVKTYAASLPADQRDQKLTLLFAGLFDKVSSQRRSVISGIEKYQKAQRERSAELERQSTAIADLETKAKTDEAAAKALDDADEKFQWAQRIFQTRQQNIPVACELPQLIEERLYAVAHAIRAEMKG